MPYQKKEQKAERRRQYLKENPEIRLQQNKDAHERQKIRIKEVREQAFQLLGNTCYICGIERTKGFQLHHKNGYSSPYNHFAKGVATKKTAVEAVEHPERFVALCRWCHLCVHVFLKEPDRLDRFLSLLEPANPLTPSGSDLETSSNRA